MSEKREWVVELRTGQKRPWGAQTPLLTSAQAPWQGLWVEHHQLLPFEANDVCCLNHVIFLQLESAITLELKHDGFFRPTRVLPGQICVLPAQKPFSLRCGDHGQFLSVSLEPNFLACAACGFENANHLELGEALAIDDPLIQAICLTLKREIESGWPGGRLYGESLGIALAVHLIQKHSVRKPPVREDRGGLAKYQLHRAIDYIENHLTEEIPLKTLAAVVGMSPYHFA